MELVIVLVIALVVLGPKRLPEVGRSLGKGIREFKTSLNSVGDDRDDDEDVEHPPEAIAATTAAPVRPAAETEHAEREAES